MAKKQPVENLKSLQPEDFGYPQQQLVDDVDLLEQDEYARAEAERKAKEDELVKRFYSTYEPVPVLDEKKLARLEKMGRINALGKGVSVIADALSAGMGGNVNRRNPDQTSPALYAAYQDTLDRHKDKTDIWNSRKYQEDQNKLMFEYGLIDKDRRNEKADRAQKERENYNAEMIRLRGEDQANKFTVDAARANAYIAAQNKRGNGTGTGGRKPVVIKTNKDTYNLSQEQTDFMRREMLKNPEQLKYLQDKYPHWFKTEYKTVIDSLTEAETQVPILVFDKSMVKDDDITAAYLEMYEDQQDEAAINERRNFTAGLGKTGQGNQSTGVVSKQPAAAAAPATKQPEISKQEAKSKWGDYARNKK